MPGCGPRGALIKKLRHITSSSSVALLCQLGMPWGLFLRHRMHGWDYIPGTERGFGQSSMSSSALCARTLTGMPWWCLCFYLAHCQPSSSPLNREMSGSFLFSPRTFTQESDCKTLWKRIVVSLEYILTIVFQSPSSTHSDSAFLMELGILSMAWSGLVMDWMCPPPRHSYVEALAPDVMLFGGGPLGGN